MSGPAAAATPGGGTGPAAAAGSIALSGGIDASGAWYLYSGGRSAKPPREASAGDQTAVVYDESGIPVLEQPLRIAHLSKGAGGVWALRVPATVPPASALRIWGRDGDLLLDVDLVLEETSPDAHAAP